MHEYYIFIGALALLHHLCYYMTTICVAIKACLMWNLDCCRSPEYNQIITRSASKNRSPSYGWCDVFKLNYLITSRKRRSQIFWWPQTLKHLVAQRQRNGPRYIVSDCACSCIIFSVIFKSFIDMYIYIYRIRSSLLYPTGTTDLITVWFFYS